MGLVLTPKPVAEPATLHAPSPLLRSVSQTRLASSWASTATLTQRSSMNPTGAGAVRESPIISGPCDCSDATWRGKLRDLFVGLPADLLKVILVGVVLFGLSFTPVGNWLRCNFFDGNGCLPDFRVKWSYLEVGKCSQMRKRHLVKTNGWQKGLSLDIDMTDSAWVGCTRPWGSESRHALP